MNRSRIIHTLGMYLRPSGQKRAAYLKKHHVLYRIGDECMFMLRKIPLYPKMISLGNNVWIASGVTLATHDSIHSMLNRRGGGPKLREHVGCIEIGDNVFIGANATILPGVTIGPDTIVAAGSVVSSSLPGGGVYAGVPARLVRPIGEYIEKRAGMQEIPIRKKKGELTEETAEALWRAHRAHRKGAEQHEQP